MSFTVLIPARLGSTRLPRKPLADLGGLPMVVRVAQRAAKSSATVVVVAADHADIVAACKDHGVSALLTRADHASGSDRLAEACRLIGLDDDAIVVNVQGDEPLIEPTLIDACAALLAQRSECVASTVAHPIDAVEEFVNPNVVKVCLDLKGRALYFSRAPIPWWREGFGGGIAHLPSQRPLRHIGLYAYRVGFLHRFASTPPGDLERVETLEQLRILALGERIAVHVTALPSQAGVDTPEDLQRVRSALA